MKNAKRQLNISKLAHKLCVFVVCTFVMFALLFSFVACSKHDYSPADYDNTPSEDTPSTPDVNPDTTPSEQELVEAFLASLSSVSVKDAVTTITVSFGERMLSQKTIEYVATLDGGSIKTTLVSLNTADAKNPYLTQESSETFGKSEYESKFPTFNLSIDYSALKNPQLVTRDGLEALNFAIDKTDISSILGLSAEDTQTIVTDVEFIVTKTANSPETIAAHYTTANGNTVELITEYKTERA